MTLLDVQITALEMGDPPWGPAECAAVGGCTRETAAGRPYLTYHLLKPHTPRLSAKWEPFSSLAAIYNHEALLACHTSLTPHCHAGGHGMEDELIERIRQGDASAFQELVESCATLAGHVARVLVPDRALAEDAVQEAWVDVWRGLPTFDARRPFRPWLLALVANRCRKAVRRRELQTTDLAAAEAGAPAAVCDLADDAVRREAGAELHALLLTLPHEQWQVLALRFFADLELAEIGLVVGIPLGTVKSRLHRALAAARERLERECSAVPEGGSR
jgi:RNA polymerase sigma factor (sigma-70 family)